MSSKSSTGKSNGLDFQEPWSQSGLSSFYLRGHLERLGKESRRNMTRAGHQEPIRICAERESTYSRNIPSHNLLQYANYSKRQSFLLFKLKMLIHQSDYITIDADRWCYYSTPVESLMNKDWGNDEKKDELRISITVQCNGKLKRVFSTFEVIKNETESTAETTLRNWKEMYILRDTMKDLWYDIPDPTQAIKKAIDTLFI